MKENLRKAFLASDFRSSKFNKLDIPTRKQFVVKWQSEKRQMRRNENNHQPIVSEKKFVEISHNYWRKIDN